MICNTLSLYPDKSTVTLSTFLWEPSSELYSGPRPAVIVCPGGAYLNCSDREADPIALRFAAMGYHAFVLRYSTYFGKGIPMPGADAPEPNTDAKHPGPLRDLGKAFLTIRDNAAEWNVDMDRVAICGFSAGAHNSAMYSVYWNDPVLTEHFGRPAEDFKPAACILCYPLTDYTILDKGLDALDNGPMGSMAKMLFRLSNTAYLGSERPSEELKAQVSPALHVGSQTPPTFLWHTAADNLVPVSQSTSMITHLARAKVPFEAHIFEEGPHGYSTADQASAGDRSQIDPAAAQWLPLVQTWLAKRFALNLPESQGFPGM